MRAIRYNLGPLFVVIIGGVFVSQSAMRAIRYNLTGMMQITQDPQTLRRNPLCVQ